MGWVRHGLAAPTPNADLRQRPRHLGPTQVPQPLKRFMTTEFHFASPDLFRVFAQVRIARHHLAGGL
jgi:hypothetical protein